MRRLVFSCFLSLLLGFYLALKIPNNNAPTTIWIQKDGQTKSYADLDSQKALVKIITDSDDPGAYLCFPIYAENSEIQ